MDDQFDDAVPQTETEIAELTKSLEDQLNGSSDKKDELILPDTLEEKPAEEKPVVEKMSIEDEIKALKETLLEKDKAIGGLKRAISDVRADRRESGGQLDKIGQALLAIKDQRNPNDILSEPEQPKDITLQINDEGDAVLSRDAVTGAVSDANKTLEAQLAAQAKEIEGLKAGRQRDNELSAADKELDSLLGSKDGYRDAFEPLKAMMAEIDKDFTSYIKDNDLQGPKDIESAITQIMNSPVSEAFAQKHPGVNIEAVLEARLYSSDRHIRRALDGLIPKHEEKKESVIDNTALLNKPRSLAAGSGAGDSEEKSIVERYADKSIDDWTDLSDAQIDQLLKLTNRG